MKQLIIILLIASTLLVGCKKEPTPEERLQQNLENFGEILETMSEMSEEDLEKLGKWAEQQDAAGNEGSIEEFREKVSEIEND